MKNKTTMRLIKRAEDVLKSLNASNLDTLTADEKEAVEILALSMSYDVARYDCNDGCVEPDYIKDLGGAKVVCEHSIARLMELEFTTLTEADRESFINIVIKNYAEVG